MITAMFTCTLLVATSKKKRGLSSWLPRNVLLAIWSRDHQARPGGADTLALCRSFKERLLPNVFHSIKWLILLWIVFGYMPFHQVFSQCHLTFIYFKVLPVKRLDKEGLYVSTVNTLYNIFNQWIYQCLINYPDFLCGYVIIFLWIHVIHSPISLHRLPWH